MQYPPMFRTTCRPLALVAFKGGNYVEQESVPSPSEVQDQVSRTQLKSVGLTPSCAKSRLTPLGARITTPYGQLINDN